MNQLLSLRLFKEMSELQKVLDAKIKKREGIEYLPLQRIKSQITMESAECINNMKGDFKYWSQKPALVKELLEEFIDVLHFYISYTNHRLEYELADEKQAGEPPLPWQTLEHDYMELVEEYKNAVYLMKEKLIHDAADIVLETPNPKQKVAYLFYIVAHYGLTERDIWAAYQEKNKINHERSDSGVY